MLPIVQGSLSQNSSKLPTKSNCKGGRELRSTLYLSGPKWHDSPPPSLRYSFVPLTHSKGQADTSIFGCL